MFTPNKNNHVYPYIIYIQMKTLITTLTLLLSINLIGQETTKIDQLELINDIQIWNKEDGRMKFTMWIPNCYWRTSLEGNPEVSEEVVTLIESLFEDYVLLCLGDIKINSRASGATITFKEKSILKNSATIIDKNNKVYLPLSENEINSKINSVLESLKPMFAQMLGQMGEGMHFFLFRVKDKDNKNIINEFQEGHFVVKHSNKEFKWVLPLPSLLQKKFCPIDNQEMKGNWNFCPFHGEKLVK